MSQRNKPFWKSRTLGVGVTQLAVGAIMAVAGLSGVPWFLGGAAMIFMRLITRHGLTLKGGRDGKNETD